MLNKHEALNSALFSEDVEKRTTRDGYAQALLELGKSNSDVVVLTADLARSNKSDQFGKAFPDKFIDVGVAEQNLAGISAGLALGGKIPIMDSYSTFSPGRNWEQIRTSICINKANVKIVSTHAGYSDGGDGATHQALEDIALLRVLPNIVILNPIDFVETKKAILSAVEYNGPVYIRLGRDATPVITTEKTPFSIGEAQTLIEGTDITIATTGSIAYEALVATKILKDKHNISAEVINFTTLKPFDEQALLKSAIKTKKVITLEEHQIAGGFGSIVCEALSENQPTIVKRLGSLDAFGESGTYQELLTRYKLTAKYIIMEAQKLCKI